MASEFHIDAALSNFAVSERFNGQEAFVAPLIATQMPVKKKSDVFYKFVADYINTDVIDIRDGNGYANEVSWTYTTDNYSTIERTLRKFSSQNELDNADDVVVVDQRDALHIKQRLMLAHEMRVHTTAAATTNRLTPTVKWDAGSSTRILADIVDAKAGFKEAVGVDPTHIVMDSLVADKLSIEAEIKDVIKYLIAGTGSMEKSLIAIPGSNGALPSVLQGMKPLVAGTFYNSKNPKATRTVSRVWGKDVYLVYVDPTPSIETPTWMKTFVFENMTMQQYIMPGKRGRYVEGYWTIDEKVTLSGAIYKICGVIS